LIKIEFRQQKWILIFEATLQGYVNDLSAGLEGGVSGHWCFFKRYGCG
jgi:hypothetical protein